MFSYTSGVVEKSCIISICLLTPLASEAVSNLRFKYDVTRLGHIPGGSPLPHLYRQLPQAKVADRGQRLPRYVPVDPAETDLGSGSCNAAPRTRSAGRSRTVAKGTPQSTQGRPGPNGPRDRRALPDARRLRRAGEAEAHGPAPYRRGGAAPVPRYCFVLACLEQVYRAGDHPANPLFSQNAATAYALLVIPRKTPWRTSLRSPAASTSRMRASSRNRRSPTRPSPEATTTGTQT